MASVRVDPADIRVVADSVAQSAVELNSSTPPPTAAAWQPTAAAVSTAHADVAAVTQVLTARLEATATRLLTAAGAYGAREDDNAANVAAVGSGVPG